MGYKIILIIVLALWAVVSHGYQTPYDILSTVSCNNDLNRHFYINEYTKQYGNFYKEEGGAVWFRGTPGDTLYDAQIKELFVSTNRDYLFVGIILGEPPEVLVERMKSSRMLPAVIFQKDRDTWVGSDNRHIMRYEGRYTKIFCLSGAK